MTTKDERYRRLAVLEQEIAERGWSLTLKRELAKRFGVSRRTVDDYKLDLVRGYRKELSGQEGEAKRAEFLGRLRGHQRAALDQGKFGPLASMLALEGRIVGIDGPAEGAGGGIVVVAPAVKT